MDFMNRANQPQQSAQQAAHSVLSGSKSSASSKRASVSKKDFNFISTFSLLICVSIVILGALFLVTRNDGNSLSSAQINTNGYQAIDVTSGGSNGDQVYFGKITKISDSQIVLTSVFYPISSDQGSSTTTLVPFVCSLASPSDKLVLNRSQVAYWYNLQDSSKITQKINEYKKANNGKADCSSLNNGTNSSDNAGDKQNTQNDQSTPAPSAGNNDQSGNNNTEANPEQRETTNP